MRWPLLLLVILALCLVVITSADSQEFRENDVSHRRFARQATTKKPTVTTKKAAVTTKKATVTTKKAAATTTKKAVATTTKKGATTAKGATTKKGTTKFPFATAIPVVAVGSGKTSSPLIFNSTGYIPYSAPLYDASYYLYSSPFTGGVGYSSSGGVGYSAGSSGGVGYSFGSNSSTYPLGDTYYSAPVPNSAVASDPLNYSSGSSSYGSSGYGSNEDWDPYAQYLTETTTEPAEEDETDYGNSRWSRFFGPSMSRFYKRFYNPFSFRNRWARRNNWRKW